MYKKRDARAKLPVLLLLNLAFLALSLLLPLSLLKFPCIFNLF